MAKEVVIRIACSDCNWQKNQMVDCPDCRTWTEAERKASTCRTCNNKKKIKCLICKGNGYTLGRA